MGMLSKIIPWYLTIHVHVVLFPGGNPLPVLARVHNQGGGVCTLGIRDSCLRLCHSTQSISS